MGSFLILFRVEIDERFWIAQLTNVPSANTNATPYSEAKRHDMRAPGWFFPIASRDNDFRYCHYPYEVEYWHSEKARAHGLNDVLRFEPHFPLCPLGFEQGDATHLGITVISEVVLECGTADEQGCSEASPKQ